MSTAIEGISTVVLLILGILLLAHLINGTATEWLKSKFVAAD